MMEIVSLLCCLLIAIGTLRWFYIKSNKILFYDKCNKKDELLLVSAGSIDKNKRVANVSLLGSITEDIDEYDKLLVDGNSMKEFGIQSGDIVLVDKNYNKEELSAKTNSIIALKIQPKAGRKIEYKLRKFIDYYDLDKESNFKQWFAENHSNLRTDKEAWEDKETGKDKRDNIGHIVGPRLVLSETRINKSWYQKRIVHYSIHSESRILGKVQCKIPRERVYILNKI